MISESGRVFDSTREALISRVPCGRDIAHWHSVPVQPEGLRKSRADEDLFRLQVCENLHIFSITVNLGDGRDISWLPFLSNG